VIFPKGGVEAESTILFGKYQICRVIGSGRSGTVFLAKHLGLDEFRAIKRVAKEGSGFLRETAVLRNLRHPGIPIIYDMEEDSIFYYLIEEYLEGESLYALVNRQGSLTGTKLISFGMELCQIMDYLHSFKPNPILYLDLQPHNILICRGTLKLIDFDQAVSVSHTGKTEKRYGTQGFAAPEQYTDEPMDVRTDIYAIGALLHYMFTGKSPEMQAIVTPGREPADLKSAGTVNSGWEEKLRAIIGRCLRRHKEERYENVREVLEELIELKQGVFNEENISLLRIAVASSSHGMGATHVSLGVAAYLTGYGIRSLYQEKNDSRSVLAMAEYLEQSPDQYGIYHIGAWELKPGYGCCVRLEQPVYNAIVEDCGTGLQPVSEKDYDLLILVCGGKWWELEDSIRAIRLLAQSKNLRVIFNHVSSEMDIVLPEDITKLSFYRMPWFPAPEDRSFGNFFEELSRKTECGQKLEKLIESRTAAFGKGRTVRERIKRLFHFPSRGGGNR